MIMHKLDMIRKEFFNFFNFLRTIIGCNLCPHTGQVYDSIIFECICNEDEDWTTAGDICITKEEKFTLN